MASGSPGQEGGQEKATFGVPGPMHRCLSRYDWSSPETQRKTWMERWRDRVSKVKHNDDLPIRAMKGAVQRFLVIDVPSHVQHDPRWQY